MADRGTAYSATADQYELDVFTHVMEPTAAFPAAGWQEVVDTTFETAVETWAPYGIAGDPPVNWSDQFDVPHGGDGFYMQEPNTHDKKLQGAPNGGATVTGTLSMNMGLGTGAAAGVATVAPVPMLRDLPLTGASAGATPISATLRNTKALSSAVSGAATVSSSQFGILGSYAEAILADSPHLYARIDEASGDLLYNHPDLGGAQVGQLDFYTRVGSLVPTAAFDATEAVQPSSGGRIVLADAGASYEYTFETWLKVPLNAAIFPQTFFEWSAWPTAAPGARAQMLQLVHAPAEGILGVSMTPADWDPGEPRIRLDIPFKLQDDRPHQIAVTSTRETVGGVAGSRLTVYIDGIEMGQGWAAISMPVGPLAGEALFSDFSTPFTIDEISMFHTALTGESIAAHWAAAYFDPPPMRGAVIGRASVSGNIGVPQALEGSSAGVATIGILGQQHVTFDGEALPPGATSQRQSRTGGTIFAATPTYVDRADSVAGTSKAMRQQVIANNFRVWTDIPFEWGGPSSNSLQVRYFVGSEPGFDFVWFLLDGTTVTYRFHEDSGLSPDWEVAEISGLAPGPHVLRVEYRKDSTDVANFDNVDVSRISYWTQAGPELELLDLGFVALSGDVLGLAALAGDLLIESAPPRPPIVGRIRAGTRRAFT